MRSAIPDRRKGRESLRQSARVEVEVTLVKTGAMETKKTKIIKEVEEYISKEKEEEGEEK